MRGWIHCHLWPNTLETPEIYILVGQEFMIQYQKNIFISFAFPATKKGKCKVYRQLVEICKDMMSTVKKMSTSYDDGKDQYYKRLAELQLGINTTIYDLEKQGK